MRMNAVFAGIVAAALGCGCHPRTEKGATAVQRITLGALTAAEIYRRSADAVVRIETPSNVATGFVVDARGFVVTHYDVVAQEREARVVLLDGNSLAVTRVLAADATRGFAVLAVEGGRRRALELARSSAATVGDPVVAIGNGLGMLTPTLAQGVIGSVRDADAGGAMGLSMPMLSGFTGGPVLDDTGHVIGIVAFADDVGTAISVAELAPLVRDMRPTSGETLAAFGDRTRHAAGRPSGGLALDDSALADCSRDSRARMWTEMQRGLELSGPIFAVGAYEAAFRVLEGTVLRLERDLDDCRTVLDVLATATADGERRANPLEGLDFVVGTYELVLELLFGTRVATPGGAAPSI